MTSKMQVIVSFALVLSAAGAVAMYAKLSDRTDQTASAGHLQHGAPAAAAEAGPVRLSAENARRIGVSYAAAEFGPLLTHIRTVGQVAYDETRLTTVSPRIEGWVEELFVDFTGAPVRKGQPLLSVYSPMLVAAQEELLLALRLADQAPATTTAGANARELLDAARRRLSNWDIAADEIARIEETGTPRKTLVLRAPASGVVVEKGVVAGTRIMPGMDLYRIADLSTVWIEGEVFEKDLARVTLGRTGRITLEAYPERSFQGRVAYVYPTVSAETRTGRIRIEVRNPDLLFKPGMYATLEFEVPVHQAGVHVPRSSVLQTGTRSLVFVREPDGTLTPREVQIGVVTSAHAEVLAGLKVGEVVVVAANFLIDAESNVGSALQALPRDAAADTASPITRHRH